MESFQIQAPGYEYPWWLEMLTPEQVQGLLKDKSCPNGTVFDNLPEDLGVRAPSSLRDSGFFEGHSNTMASRSVTELDQLWLSRFPQEHPVYVVDNLYTQNLQLVADYNALCKARNRVCDDKSILEKEMTRLVWDRKQEREEHMNLKQSLEMTKARLDSTRTELWEKTEVIEKITEEGTQLQTKLVDLEKTIGIQGRVIARQRDELQDYQTEKEYLEDHIKAQEKIIQKEEDNKSKLEASALELAGLQGQLRVAARLIQAAEQKSLAMEAELKFEKLSNRGLRQRNSLLYSAGLKARNTIDVRDATNQNLLSEHLENETFQAAMIQTLAATITNQDKTLADVQIQLDRALGRDSEAVSSEHDGDDEDSGLCQNIGHQFLVEKIAKLDQQLVKLREETRTAPLGNITKITTQKKKSEQLGDEFTHLENQIKGDDLKAQTEVDMLKCEILNLTTKNQELTKELKTAHAEKYNNEKHSSSHGRMQDETAEKLNNLDTTYDATKRNLEDQIRMGMTAHGVSKSEVEAQKANYGSLTGLFKNSFKYLFAGQGCEECLRLRKETHELRNELAETTEEFKTLDSSHEEQSDIMLEQGEEIEILKNRLGELDAPIEGFEASHVELARYQDTAIASQLEEELRGFKEELSKERWAHTTTKQALESKTKSHKEACTQRDRFMSHIRVLKDDIKVLTIMVESVKAELNNERAINATKQEHISKLKIETIEHIDKLAISETPQKAVPNVVKDDSHMWNPSQTADNEGERFEPLGYDDDNVGDVDYNDIDHMKNLRAGNEDDNDPAFVRHQRQLNQEHQNSSLTAAEANDLGPVLSILDAVVGANAALHASV